MRIKETCSLLLLACASLFSRRRFPPVVLRLDLSSSAAAVAPAPSGWGLAASHDLREGGQRDMSAHPHSMRQTTSAAQPRHPPALSAGGILGAAHESMRAETERATLVEQKASESILVRRDSSSRGVTLSSAAATSQGLASRRTRCSDRPCTTRRRLWL